MLARRSNFEFAHPYHQLHLAYQPMGASELKARPPRLGHPLRALWSPVATGLTVIAGGTNQPNQGAICLDV